MKRCFTITRSSHLHIPPPSHHDRLPTNIAKHRTRDRQHSARCLCRRTRSPQRDIHVFLALRSPLLRLRYAQRNLLAIGCGDESALLLRRRQARLDVSEGDRVCANAELRTPSIYLSVLEWVGEEERQHTP
jgi:hypothetical protein